MKGLVGNYNTAETIAILNTIKVGTMVSWEETENVPVGVKTNFGIVTAVWKGAYPRLVVTSNFGTKHYLRDMGNVRVFSGVDDRFISARNYSRVYR